MDRTFLAAARHERSLDLLVGAYEPLIRGGYGAGQQQCKRHDASRGAATRAQVAEREAKLTRDGDILESAW
jgi:hypothetical protein